MIKFYKNRKWFYLISICLMLIGIVSLFIRGVELDIQFSGGTKLSYSYVGEISTTDVETIVTDILGKKATAQTQTAVSDDTDRQTVVISFGDTSSLTTEQLDKITDEITAKYPDNSIELYETQSVEPYIGKRFFTNGIKAMLIAMVLIVIYVTFRFKIISGFSAALTALLALFHDLLLVFFTFVIFGIPINDGFVAVVLTILGYSVNDTIVIYDKIRYNKRMYAGKMSIEEIADTSINQCMRRTINTSLMSGLAVALVFIFSLISGLTSVSNFALPLLVGIVSGCYSSLTLPGTLWVSWQKIGENKKAKAK